MKFVRLPTSKAIVEINFSQHENPDIIVRQVLLFPLTLSVLVFGLCCYRFGIQLGGNSPMQHQFLHLGITLARAFGLVQPFAYVICFQCSDWRSLASLTLCAQGIEFVCFLYVILLCIEVSTVKCGLTIAESSRRSNREGAKYVISTFVRVSCIATLVWIVYGLFDLNLLYKNNFEGAKQFIGALWYQTFSWFRAFVLLSSSILTIGLIWGVHGSSLRAQEYSSLGFGEKSLTQVLVVLFLLCCVVICMIIFYSVPPDEPLEVPAVIFYVVVIDTVPSISITLAILCLMRRVYEGRKRIPTLDTTRESLSELVFCRYNSPEARNGLRSNTTSDTLSIRNENHTQFRGNCLTELDTTSIVLPSGRVIVFGDHQSPGSITTDITSMYHTFGAESEAEQYHHPQLPPLMQ